jgi:hypothetical protein
MVIFCAVRSIDLFDAVEIRFFGKGNILSDAASADVPFVACRVGYNDASHFNLEYKSLFGLPPMRDMKRLRGNTRGNVSLAAD